MMTSSYSKTYVSVCSHEVVAQWPYYNVVTVPYDDIIVFQNLCTRPFTFKQEAGVFKKVHSEDRFGKTSFLVSEIAVYA